MVPDVLVHAEHRYVLVPGRVVGELGQQRLDRLPQRVPVHPEPPRDGRDRGGVALDAADRPPRRPGGEFGSGEREIVVLGEHLDTTKRLAAAPAADPPAQLDRRPERGDVMQHAEPATVADRENPAARAAHRTRMGLDRQRQPVPAPADLDHVHAVQVEQRVDSGAVAARLGAAHRRLGHR